MTAFPEQLRTERLLLERWDFAAHTPGFAELCADPEVMRFMANSAVLAPDEAAKVSKKIADHWTEHGFGLWAAIELETGQNLGFIGVCHPTWLPGFGDKVEIGWRLRRDSWGKGFATEGARVAFNIAFATLELDELLAFVDIENTRSVGIVRKLGMTYRYDTPDPEVPSGAIGVYSAKSGGEIRGTHKDGASG